MGQKKSDKVKAKIIFLTAIVSVIMSSCKNENSNDFYFTKSYWECPREGGHETFASNIDDWKIDQITVDGIIIKEYSQEYVDDKNQRFPPNEFEYDFFSFKIEEKKVTFF